MNRTIFSSRTFTPIPKKIETFLSLVSSSITIGSNQVKMSAENENMIVGLKTQVKRQVGLKNWNGDMADYNMSVLMKTWFKLYCIDGEADDNTILIEDIWNYVEGLPLGAAVWKKMESSSLGMYSVIGEYISKKGVKSLAHYTENGNYLGSVKNMGDKPVSYQGNFKVTRDRFRVDLSKLRTIQPLTPISHLFVAK